MIITITLNPSVDRTVGINALKIGSVNRVDLLSVDPGGKGVNVSRALSAFGAKTFALIVCGSFGSRWFTETLAELEIENEILLVDGITRSNVTIVEEISGSVTKINEPGFELTAEMVAEVKKALGNRAQPESWVVFAGRLNPGADADTYSHLVDYAHSLGAKVAVDASGDELLSVARNAKPDLIKPNQHELAELVARELHTIEDIIDAAKEVLTWGVGSVLCSLGADGAILISAREIVHAEPTHPVVGVPVGAGDILLATFIAGGANGSALRDAVAWSAASVPLEGTSIPTIDQVNLIEVRINSSLDSQRPLVEVN